MSNLLLDERPLIVLPSLAAMLNSLDEAVILQQIHYWIEKKQNYREGRYWVYNSMEKWMQHFPWIKSRTTLTRYFKNLEAKGLLITGNFNKAGFDKTKWYTIDYYSLSDFEQRTYRTCTTSDQNLVNGMNRACTTNTIDYTETTTETTTNNNGQAQPDGLASSRKEIIEYLNQKLGTAFKPNAAKNRTFINARLKEGYTVDDFKKVIDNQIANWGTNPKMVRYLRPETLFGTKFDGYLNPIHVQRTERDQDLDGFAGQWTNF